MQIRTNTHSTTFTQWLLDVGHARPVNSQQPAVTVFIKDTIHTTSENDLIESVYESLAELQTVPSPDTSATGPFSQQEIKTFAP
jgi:hypothetical protein